MTDQKLVVYCETRHPYTPQKRIRFSIQYESIQAPWLLITHIPLVFRDTFSHLHPRQMRRQGARKNFAQHIHTVVDRITGTSPNKITSWYKLKHTQIHKLKYVLQQWYVPALIGPWLSTYTEYDMDLEVEARRSTKWGGQRMSYCPGTLPNLWRANCAGCRLPACIRWSTWADRKFVNCFFPLASRPRHGIYVNNGPGQFPRLGPTWLVGRSPPAYSPVIKLCIHHSRKQERTKRWGQNFAKPKGDSAKETKTLPWNNRFWPDDFSKKNSLGSIWGHIFIK